MKKKLLGMAVAVLSVSALVACTKAEPTVDVEEVEPTIGVVEEEPEEGGVQSAIGSALTSYDSIIANLSEGQYYGFAAAGETCDLLLVTDGVFDNGDGTMAAIDATVYGIDADGNVVELGVVTSAGTAYPIAVVDDCLISGSNHTMMMEYYGANGSMMTKLYASESFDEEGNATYSVFDLDAEYEGPVDDDSRLMEMFDKYSEASVINFMPAN